MSNRLTKKDVLFVIPIVALTFMSIFIYAFELGELLIWGAGSDGTQTTASTKDAQKSMPSK